MLDNSLLRSLTFGSNHNKAGRRRPPTTARRRAARLWALERLEERTLLSLLMVNTAADDTAPDSTLSLREAILVSNGTLPVSALSPQEQAQVSGPLSVPNTIHFAIPGTGVHTIQPTSPLPTITQPVFIDGYSQPGARANCQTQGDDAVLLIQLDGSQINPNLSYDPAAGYNRTGLVITCGASTVRGLAINRFGYYGIQTTGTGGNVVEGNFIGTDVTGTVPLGNGYDGVYLGSDANRVGTNGDGVEDPAERNVLSGSVHGSGVFITSATGNVVTGNYIGTDSSGKMALGNGLDGVTIAGATSNFIGVNGAPSNLAAEGNLISANHRNGVSMVYGGSVSVGNVVAGNYIGTDATGTQTTYTTPDGITQPLGNRAEGVLLDPGSGSDWIGTNGDGVNDSAERNVISGNGDSGVLIYSPGNVVAGNFIGTDATGSKRLGNGSSGVTIDDASAYTGVPTNTSPSENRIGVDGHDAGFAAERNVISGNAAYGILMTRRSPAGNHDNTVAGNYIGTDATGEAAVPNSAGVVLQGSNRDWIGANSGHPNAGAERNVIAGNSGGGLLMGGSIGGVVAGNYIGLDAAGTVGLGNAVGPYSAFSGVGVLLSGCQGVRIGTDGVGDPAAERNVIAGHTTGIAFGGSNGNQVFGNYIGSGATGLPVASGIRGNDNGVGMFDGSTNNTIGGLGPLANTITDYFKYGVGAGDPSQGNTIRYNSIDSALSYSPGSGHPLGIDMGEDGLATFVNLPAIDSVRGGGTTLVSGSLRSTPGAHFTIDFYATASDLVQASGYGPGQVYLGSAPIDIGPDGNGRFDNVSLMHQTTSGQWISATATLTTFDAGGVPTYLGTSEFSRDVQVVQAATVTTLTSSANSTLVGQPVTFTATVSAGGTSTPTGSVDFYDGATKIGSGNLSGGGVAAFGTADLAAGSHCISAVYLGDLNDLTSTSAAVTQTVLAPASLSGVVFSDFNNDGQVDFGEKGIAGVPITLAGTDDLGHSVNLSQTTDGAGTYVFQSLRPGSYTITETQQPAGYTPGIATVGTGGGTVSGAQFLVSLPVGVNAMSTTTASGRSPPGTSAKARRPGSGSGTTRTARR